MCIYHLFCKNKKKYTTPLFIPRPPTPPIRTCVRAYHISKRTSTRSKRTSTRSKRTSTQSTPAIPTSTPPIPIPTSTPPIPIPTSTPLIPTSTPPIYTPTSTCTPTFTFTHNVYIPEEFGFNLVDTTTIPNLIPLLPEDNQRKQFR
jgi:hypothetical protein